MSCQCSATRKQAEHIAVLCSARHQSHHCTSSSSSTPTHLRLVVLDHRLVQPVLQLPDLPSQRRVLRRRLLRIQLQVPDKRSSEKSGESIAVQHCEGVRRHTTPITASRSHWHHSERGVGRACTPPPHVQPRYLLMRASTSDTDAHHNAASKNRHIGCSGDRIDVTPLLPPDQ